jgi:hypothetical protein
MTLTTKGSRRIAVDGTEYRWRIRRKPSYGQGLGWTPLTYAVELTGSNGPGTTLVVTTGQPHPSNWVGAEAIPIRPARVAESIREARAHSWEPAQPGSPFLLDQSAGFVPMS